MNKCEKCGKDFKNGEIKCPHCGWERRNKIQSQSQLQVPTAKPGVKIETCQHCKGSGECWAGRTKNVAHSCVYCSTKAGRNDDLFPKVPCGYCDKGFIVIDLKISKDNGQSQKGKGNKK